MKFNKLVLALSLASVTSVASAAAATFAPTTSITDPIIMQTSVSSGLQLGVVSSGGIAIACVEAVGVSGVQPTASISVNNDLAGVPLLVPVTTVTGVDANVYVVGTGSATALVTQESNALVVVPTGAITTIATLIEGPLLP
jgi:hypothetical protein